MPEDVGHLPEDLRYSPEHQWLRLEGELGRVGITDYAQMQLGEIVFVKLPKTGDRVEFMKPMGEIESWKVITDLHSPISGVVADVNASLDPSPQLVNQDPYGEGWMLLVRIDNRDEVEQLLSHDDYAALVQSRSSGRSQDVLESSKAMPLRTGRTAR
jgi:glycine cleavage system H protein